VEYGKIPAMNESPAYLSDLFAVIIATLGGTTVVLGALFGWLGKRYLDSRLEAERNQYAVALEGVKSSYDKHVHVYKAQFELEFKTYQEVWAATTTLMDHVARLAALYGLSELPSGKGEKRKHAKSADSAFFAAHIKITNNQPFITGEIYKLALAHAVACKREIDEFFGAIDAEEKGEASYSQKDASREAREAQAKISNQFEELGAAIRSRLASITVIDA
jgi:hypothetical protein